MFLNSVVALGWSAVRAPLRPASLRHHVLTMQEDFQAQRGLVIGAARAAFLFADADGSGSLDREEVLHLMERMMAQSSSDEREDDSQDSSTSSTPMEEMEKMFTKYSRQDSELRELSYENWVLLLSDCEVDSALFTGLLSFAEGAVSAGVKERFDTSSTSAQRTTHILDDGTQVWRESIEAAFELCDAERTGEVSVASPDHPAIHDLTQAWSRLRSTDIQGTAGYGGGLVPLDCTAAALPGRPQPKAAERLHDRPV